MQHVCSTICDPRMSAQQVYSNIKKFREDLTTYPPDFFVCVPLVLDTLHSRVRASVVVCGLSMSTVRERAKVVAVPF